MFQGLAQAYRGGGGVGRPTSNIVSLPPPIGGWNARDAVTEISAVTTNYGAAEAIVLDNWMPTIGGVRIRKGFAEHVTGLTGDYVESLMSYHPASGTAKLFAATPTRMYDVTTSGSPVVRDDGEAEPAELVFSNGRWSHVNFSTPAVKVLYICNGEDAPEYYDGSTWTTSTFTGSGLTLTDLDYVHAHLFRLWFIEKNTLNAWYGPTAAVAGTLNKLDLSALCRKGGRLVAIGSWTRDGGAGPDDYLIFVTSEGEVVMWAGTDPTTVTGSALIGVYPLPRPVGARCLLPLGGDLALLTEHGLLSLSGVLALSASAAKLSSVTDKISGAFHEAFHGGNSAFGWQPIEYAHDLIAIINVPVIERDTQHQYVMNTQTGAWCRLKGMDAGCWAIFGHDLYFGGNDGTVQKYGGQYTDNGDPIDAVVQTAFSTFKQPGIKAFRAARPLFAGPPSFLPKVEMRLDYDTQASSVTPIFVAGQGATWDEEFWDAADWDSGVVPVVTWQAVYGAGIAGSVAFAISAATDLVYNGVDVMYEPGGPL
jgi:hypothetical protein